MKTYKEWLNEMVYLRDVEPSTNLELIRSELLNLKNFVLRHGSSNDTFIVVDLNKLIDIFEKTDPDFAVTRDSSLGSRIPKFIEYVSKFVNLPKESKRSYLLEAPMVYLKNDGITFSDGRHRAKAMQELGCKQIVIEVTKKEKDKILRML